MDDRVGGEARETILRRINGPREIEIMGLPIQAFTYRGMIEHLVTRSAQAHGGYAVTVNLAILSETARDERLRDQTRAAEVRVADGMPLLWASRIQGEPLPGRVAGSDLIFDLSEALALSGRSLFLLGGEADTAERTAAILRARSPALNIVGVDSPPHGYDRDPQGLARIVSLVADAAPDFVYVGLPFAKTSALITALKVSMPGTWFLSVGASFNFVSGEIARAPGWMQRVGLEWVHRLLHEPRRLGRRYLIEGLPFAVALLWRSLQRRRAAAGGAAASR